MVHRTETKYDVVLRGVKFYITEVRHRGDDKDRRHYGVGWSECGSDPFPRGAEFYHEVENACAVWGLDPGYNGMTFEEFLKQYLGDKDL